MSPRPCKHLSTETITLKGKTLRRCRLCGAIVDHPTLKSSFEVHHEAAPAHVAKMMNIRNLCRSVRNHDD